MTKTKYLFPPLTRILQTMKTGSIYAAGAIVLFFTISSMAIATTLGTHDNQSYRAGEYYYNFKTCPRYNLGYNVGHNLGDKLDDNAAYNPAYKMGHNPNSGNLQLSQNEQGWQSGQVDHLGQSGLEIYTNEQGDEVMRTTPTPQRNNEQGNTYYISPQIYPMPNGHGYPPPHFRPGQKPNPRPKP